MVVVRASLPTSVTLFNKLIFSLPKESSLIKCPTNSKWVAKRIFIHHLHLIHDAANTFLGDVDDRFREAVNIFITSISIIGNIPIFKKLQFLALNYPLRWRIHDYDILAKCIVYNRYDWNYFCFNCLTCSTVQQYLVNIHTASFLCSAETGLIVIIH